MRTWVYQTDLKDLNVEIGVSVFAVVVFSLISA